MVISTRIVCIFLFLSFFTALLSANEKEDALSYINSLRQKSGLIKFKANKRLDKAASSHASYLLRQQKHGHYEKKGWRGYTGKTPSDRVLKAGYASKSVMENVTENAKNYRHSIDILFAAIYHRFVFLNFENDEIGMGSASTKKKRKVTSAFVYNVASTEINRLCKSFHLMENNTYYLQNMCKNSEKLLPKQLYEQKQNKVRRKNNALILYPYAGAKDVLPVFYTENPHPLPGSKVSGYPVSVQFNSAFYKKVTLKKFRLYGANGKRIKKVKILTSKSDKNRRFTKLQFALMPLKRLEYATTYKVVFEAIADGKRVKKSWKFTTKKAKGSLYKITKKRTTLKVKKGEKITLYFEPKSNKDVLNCISYTDKLNITCVDHNTLLVDVPRNRKLPKKCIVETNHRTVTLLIH